MAVIDSVKLPDNSTYDVADNYSGYAKKVAGATTDDLASLTATGDLADSGKKLSDLVLKSDVKDVLNSTSTTDPLSAKQGKKLADHLSHENFVDNPFFTVNERGNTSFSSAGYTVDRWAKEASGGGTLTLTSDGIQFPASQSGGNLYQLFESGKFLNKEITVTLKYSDSSFVKGTLTYTTPATVINDGKMKVYLYDDTILLQHNTTDATARTIRAVKLELGSISTLANDVAPDYALELAKCQTSTADPSDTYANQGQLMTSALQGVYGAKNLNSYPYDETTKSGSGVTFTDNGDGTITVTGTASADVQFTCHSIDLKVDNGTYKLNGCPPGGSYSSGYSIYCNWYQSPGVPSTTYKDEGAGTDVVINGSEDSADYAKISIAILIKSGTALPVGGVTFKPMLRDARITDPTFVPYAMTNRELTVSELKHSLKEINLATYNCSIAAYGGYITDQIPVLPSGYTTLCSVTINVTSGITTYPIMPIITGNKLVLWLPYAATSGTLFVSITYK